MLYTICYISSVNNNISSKDLNALFIKTKHHNLKYNISGILICNNKNFFQVLEGRKGEIIELYKIIKTDIRHKHIIPIIKTNIVERVFNDYEAGFEIIDNQNKINQLEEYLNWLKEAEIESVDKVIKIVENFIERKSY